MAMKVPVYDIQGQKRGEIALGRSFSGPVRTDLIRRAFLAEQSHLRQAYGTDPLAGKRTSAHYHGLRHYRYTMMNREMARMKRIHSQGFLNYTARFVPQAIKGREAHPPKTEKIWTKKINQKERRLALRAALAATANQQYVLNRGHTIDNVPLVVEDSLQELKKTKDIKKVLEKLGLEKEMEKPIKKIRSGRGKRRGRKYRKRAGPLLIMNAATRVTIPGFEIALVKELGVTHLAPGGMPGRLCIWTRSAFEEAGKL